MDPMTISSKVVPFSLKDAPSLIERVWPAQKISIEAQKERKAVQGQTLVGLASYWKGRKPLCLARACVLGSLLPATSDPAKDVEVFEILMGMDDTQIIERFYSNLTIEEIEEYGSESQKAALLEKPDDDDTSSWSLKQLPRQVRFEIMASVMSMMPYQKRVGKLKRAEEIDEDTLTGKHMDKVNLHLGTNARSLSELLQQLGQARFGHNPIVADTFSGGGSIPFEASRLGCDTVASDLNPIACMLTWGAVEFLGSDEAFFARFEKERRRVIDALDTTMLKTGYETGDGGSRARIYLYCVEALHHASGWRIPLSPSWVLHEGTKTILTLVPDPENKCFKFVVKAGATKAQYESAKKGTVQDGFVVFFDGKHEVRISIADLRGDKPRVRGEETDNALRRWSKDDVSPRDGDIFGERLCAIKWTDKSGNEYFSAPSSRDEENERKLIAVVKSSLAEWQKRGYVPDMAIEPGDNNSQPIKERGWTYWHHLFNPRQLFMFANLMSECASIEDERIRAGMFFIVAKALNRGSRLCQWQPHRAISGHVFYNQALNTFYNYGCRAFSYFKNIFEEDFSGRYIRKGASFVEAASADAGQKTADIFITDPPYADAVNYHEITEFFIAWFRKNPPKPFAKWTWDSRRPLAIKGDGEDFKRGMISAYKSMSDRMPINGMQIVMFTHQDAGVWADMAQILWGAGLQVMSAWYIATETTSELKKGGYVQGTVILVLRKRSDGEHGYKDEIVQEVKVEVAEQIDTMAGLNQKMKGHGRVENLFEDADLQMAGYAAALRVLTRYSTIDGADMAKEAVRPKAKGEHTLVGEIIKFAVQVANEHMVPEGMNPKTWENLTGAERFYFKMMDVETTGAKKLDNYQNFSKAFRVASYDELMGNMQPNKARLKSAKDFESSGFEIEEFGPSKSRALLYAIWEMERDVDGDEVLAHLRDQVDGYYNVREDLLALADYIAHKRENIDAEEARAARIVHGLIRNERFG